MHFLKSSFSYLVRALIFGMFLRGCVAFYMGFWSLSQPSTIFSTFKNFFYGWHYDLAMAAFLYFILFGSLTLIGYSKGKFKFLNYLLWFLYMLFIVTDSLYMKE